jgi:hypothetical protein
MKLNFGLFRNDKKQGNQPDYRSPMNTPITITEPGEYRVAGWKKETKEGAAYLSCILERVEPGQTNGPSRDQNVAQIQQVRQALEQGRPVPQGYRPAQQNPAGKYPNPQHPPSPTEDDLPF